MTITAGVDVGSGAVKAVIMECVGDEARIIARASARIRRREIAAVVDEVFGTAVRAADVAAVDYVATTGEGEDVPFATGHFYGMTTHARGGLYPRARGARGARRRRAAQPRHPDGRAGQGHELQDDQPVRLGLRASSSRTSPATSASRRPRSASCRWRPMRPRRSRRSVRCWPRPTSSTWCRAGSRPRTSCAASTRAWRFVSPACCGRSACPGSCSSAAGWRATRGLLAALQDALDEDTRFGGAMRVTGHPLSLFAGALGAAMWGAFRHQRLKLGGAAWTASTATTAESSSAT